VNRQLIGLSGLTLSANSLITITYGAGGGQNAVLPSSTIGMATFVTEEQSSQFGVLTPIATSPVVQVSMLSARTLSINEGSVSTFAGSGAANNADGSGTSAAFNSPRGEAIIANTLYVLDADAIRAVNLSSKAVTTLAGPGSSGGSNYTDSSNPADVTFDNPASLTTDGVYLYFVDNGSIRRTNATTGATTTVACGNIYLYVTEGADGMLYATGLDSQLVQINPTTDATDTVTTTGGWMSSGQISSNSTALYVRTNGGSIYRIPYSTFTPSMLTSNSVLSDDDDGFTAAGNYLYAVTNSGTAISRYDATTGTMSPVAGSSGTSGYLDGTYYSGWISDPQALVSDGQGTLYVADTNNNRIRAVTEANPQPDPSPGLSSGLTTTLSINEGSVSTFAGSGAANNADGSGTSAAFNSPRGEAIIANTLYVLDADAIRAVNLSSKAVTTLAGPGSSGGSNYTDSSNPADVTFDNPASLTTDGVYLYFVDNGSIRRTNATTGATTTVACGNIYLYVTEGADGMLYATGLDSQLVQINPTTDATDTVTTTGGWMSSGQISSNSTALYVRTNGGSIYRIPYSTFTPSMLTSNSVLSDDDDGFTAAGNYLYAVTNSGTAISRYDATTGTMSPVAGSSGTSGYLDGTGSAALFYSPEALVSDGVGRMFVADSGNNRIRAMNGEWYSPIPIGGAVTTPGNISQTWGGDNPAEPGVDSGSDGNPVNPATGDFSRTFTDASVATDGPSLSLTRTYDSNLAQYQSGLEPPSSGPFGPGWVDDFSTNVSVDQSGDVTVTEDDGSEVGFVPESGTSCPAQYPGYVFPALGGTYCALPRVTASLTLAGSNYVFTLPDGTTYTYGSNGNLVSIADRYGNRITAYYGTSGSSSCPTTPVSYETLTSSAPGRSLVIGWSGSGESGTVVSLVDPMGRQWCYGYDAAGNLTSATDPMGHVTTYSYDESNSNPDHVHDLVSITLPNGQSGGPDAGAHLQLGYDSLGRVTSVVDPMGNASSYNYTGMDRTSGNGDVIFTDPDGTKTEYYYENGELSSETTGYEGTSTSTVNAVYSDTTLLLPTASADGNGNVTNDSYDNNGNVLSETDAAGNTTSETYNSFSEPVTVTEPGGAETNGPTAVLPGGVITPPTTTPPEGVTVTLYDTYGNALYATTGVYNPPGAPTAPYVQTTYTLYSGNSVTLNGTNDSCQATPPTPNLPCAAINANGVVTQLAYDSDGDLVSSSTPDGNGSEIATTTYTYNGDGQQTSTVSPDGNLSGAKADNYTTVTAYNADGDVASTTEAGGTAGSGPTVTPRTTYNYYDGDGNLTSVQDARGHTTTSSYNADDEKVLGTDPDGNATLTCYDGDGHVTITVPSVGVAANSLTAASCPTSYPSGYGDRLGASDATTYTYDASGNKASMTTPAPAGQTGFETTTYLYDSAGNLIETVAPPTSNATGAANDDTVDSYNSVGQLASATTGYGTSAVATTSYCYDDNGNTTAVVAPDGNTGAVVTVANDTVTVTGLATCETSYPWVVSSTAFPTQAAYQTTYNYDSANELVKMILPATSAAPNGITTTYSYDPVGNKSASTDGNGVTTTYAYTPANLVSSINYSGSSAHSVGLSYDANGNKVAMTDATGSSSFVYDPFGELVSADNGSGQTVAYAYNTDAEVTGITYPLPSTASWATSATVAYGYDNADRLTSVNDFNNNTISISNTADGTPFSETLGSSGDAIVTTYDQTDSPSVINLQSGSSILLGFSYSDAPSGATLSETDTPSSSQAPADYSYDARGRVTSMTPGSGSTLSYGFDASGSLTTLPNGATGTYDNAGELTSSVFSGTTTSYAYDADGEQLSTKQGSTTVASGSWNGAGELTSYSDPVADMTSAIYDGDGLRASEASTPAGGSAVTQNFVWNTISTVPNLLMDSTNAYIFADGGTPIEQVSLAAGAIDYLVADSLGSVRGVVASSGSLVGACNYDAWGNPETAGGLSNYTPFGFAGAYSDLTGEIYLIGRYYDPQGGQFLSVDPKVQQTQQAFSYAGDDPVQLTDPSGGTTIGLAGGYLPDYAQCGDSDDVGSDQWRQCTQLNAEGYGSMAVGQTSVNLFAAFDSAWHVANRVWDASGGKLVHWVKEHPADAIEITLAVASVATGGVSMLGDFVTLPDLLAGNLPAIGEFSQVAGVASTGLSIKSCMHHDQIACYTAVFSGTGVMADAAGGVFAAQGYELGRSVGAGLKAMAANFGMAGLVLDAVRLVVVHR
jgi:RHS repeat-associated protein